MSPGPILAAIADDLTGAVELAGLMEAQGVSTDVVGDVGDARADADVIVVSQRSRTCLPQDARLSTADALRHFKALGFRQVFFKYCATFDSIAQGNIGPCADEIFGATGASSLLFCPSFPEVDRTVYRGHLFVGDQLVSDSPKRLDPLTPMTEPNLVRVLAPQTDWKVGLLPLPVVRRGADAIREFAAMMAGRGVPYLIADTIADDDLRLIAHACWDWPAMTGGSSIAAHYPQIWRAHGLLGDRPAPPLPRRDGFGLVLAGSCAEQTLRQIDAFAGDHPVLRVEMLGDEAATVAKTVDEALALLPGGPLCVATSAGPADQARIQESLGVAGAARKAERMLAAIGRRLVEHGVSRIVVAGGETSGAILEALDVKRLRAAPYRAPGLGLCYADAPKPLSFCLKSGKLGEVDLFCRVLAEMAA